MMDDIQVHVPDGSVRKYKHGVTNEALLRTLRATYGVGTLTNSEGFDITDSDDGLNAGIYTYVPIPSSNPGNP